MTRRELSKLIDHTCLSPDATAGRIDRLCDEAVEHGMGVCIAPTRVARAVGRVAGKVRVVSVCGFPHGTSTAAIKRREAGEVLALGASEIDMVMNVGAFRDGDDAAVEAEIASVAELVAVRPGLLLKVILETALLSNDEIARACALAERAGADFVKTSTGFGPGGATIEAVTRMRASVSARIGVKAAGGIRDYAAAMAMLEAGATRLGCSASLDVLRGAPA